MRLQIKFRNAIVAIAALAAVPMIGAAAAQDYPTRAVTIIVPFTAGGPNDVAARVYADGLRRHFGASATIVIENRPAAPAFRAPRLPCKAIMTAIRC